VPGLINVDFADVKAVMANAGSALMGIGQATGENKAIEAAKAAVSSSLLEVSIEGARGILFTITGGPNLAMSEVNEAAKVITASADEDAKIIFGTIINEKMKDEIKITVVATGFDNSNRVNSREETAPERTAYTPNPFISEEEKKDKGSGLKFFGSEKKRSKASPLKAAQAEPAKNKDGQEENEDELGIPAFIRKKMM
jgi:cell division protein FtsZ